MDDIKITLVQSPLHWENIDENLVMFSQKLAHLKQTADIIVLPEMFSTGFSMNPASLAEEKNGKTMQWMKKAAREKNCIITGSIIIKEEEKYFNRLIWQRPDGSNDCYNKKHLFRFAKENEKYTAGNKKLIIEHKGWKICPLICYDLRFPVWCRNKVMMNGYMAEFAYDVLLFVANWPERRNHPWKTLLQARAMENQCYVIGVNRIGEDGNKILYSGDSMVVNPKGEVISKIKAHEEGEETVILQREELNDWRKVFPAWMDADGFTIEKEN